MSRCVNFSFEEFRKSWPSPIVARTEIGKFTGGMISEKYMANIDSKGIGPARIRCGRKIGYPVASLVQWLEARSEACE